MTILGITIGPAAIWIGLAILFAVIEASTLGLTTIWFALGALSGALTSVFTDSILVQIVIFLLVSILSLVITKPIVSKYFSRKIVKTNADALIGETGVVIEKIVPGHTGQVKINGQMWSAVAEDEPINEDELVIVQKISGVKLVVTKK